MAEVEPAPAQAPTSFCIAELGDQCAVYDRRSGRTHLLSPLMAEILRLARDAVRPAPAALRDTLLRELDIAEGELPLAVVEDALEQLRTASLVD